MTELFRLELLKLMVKRKVLALEVADNLLSWQNSGFHVYATEPFSPADTRTLTNRLTFDPSPSRVVNSSINSLHSLSNHSGHRDGMVKVTTRKQTIALTPLDFIAKLTLHIPDRYQNVRRYAGFYSSNIQQRVRVAKPENSAQPILEVRPPVKPKWATLIAMVFGKIPIVCPRCGTSMDLKEFVFDVRWICKIIPELSRAPPKIVFDRDVVSDGIVYAQPEDATTTNDAHFDQTVPENNNFFNQEINW